MRGLSNVYAVFRREFAAYFTTPLAYVFLVVFLALAGALTFYIGNFFEREQADLEPFFTFHPWLYLFLIPAISMRLWAEERKTGTAELLLTLPISIPEAVIGKFLAAWAFTAVALALTFPIWISVNILGNPDNGVIASGYVGALIVAGAFLSVGSAMSAVTKNQVIAFVLGLAVCFLFAMASYSVVTDFLSQNIPTLAAIARRIAVIDRFHDFTRGVVSLRDLVFFASFIGFWLFVTAVLVERNKAG